MSVLEGEDDVTRVAIHHPPKESPRKKGKAVKREPEGAAPVVVSGAAPDVPPRRRSHALDHAAVGSSLVVVDTNQGRIAVLSVPGSHPAALPKEDEAALLPVGAKIRKVASDEYRSVQLNPQVLYPETTHATAVDAIGAFIEHFHPDWRQP